MEKIKQFEEIKKGDRVHGPLSLFDTLDELGSNEGLILDKGTFDQLVEEGYHSSILKGELLEYAFEEDLEECIAVSMNPERTFEGFTSEIFLYGYGDPCFAYVIVKL